MENNVNIINGKDTKYNANMLAILQAYCEKLYQKGSVYKDNEQLLETVEIIDAEHCVLKEDKKKYDLLTRLITYLSFEKQEKKEVYEFFGFGYGDKDGFHKATIYLTKENAYTIGKLAKDYEEELKEFGIIIPHELYQLKNRGQNMPGLDYGAPEPKTADQTIDDYEKYLATYYHGHGIEPEPSQVYDFRQSYPHERVDYRKEPAEMSNIIFGHSYFESTTNGFAKKDLEEVVEEEPPQNTPEEEEFVITDTDEGLGRKIGDALKNIKNRFTSPNFKDKAFKGIAMASLGVTLVSMLAANPFVTVALVGGGAALVGGGIALSKPIKKGWKAFKKKVHEWLYGKELTPAEQLAGKHTLAEIQQMIMNNLLEQQKLTAEIDALKAEIDAMEDDNPDKKKKQEERDKKVQELKVKQEYNITLAKARDILAQQELDAGGPVR